MALEALGRENLSPLVRMEDNRTQIALAERLYARTHDGIVADQNQIMLAWIEGGYAEKYRAQIEKENSPEIDLSDTAALDALLAKFEADRTVH